MHTAVKSLPPLIETDVQEFIMKEGYLISILKEPKELIPVIWVHIYRQIPRLGFRKWFYIWWHNITIIPEEIGQLRFPRDWEDREAGADYVLDMYEPYRRETGPLPTDGQNIKDMEALASKISEVFGFSIKTRLFYTVPIEGGIEAR